MVLYDSKYGLKREKLYLVLGCVPSLFIKDQKFLFDIEFTVNDQIIEMNIYQLFYSSIDSLKNFFIHFNLARHLMASIITMTLFFLCRTNVFTSRLSQVYCHGNHSCKHGINCFFVGKAFTFISFNID